MDEGTVANLLAVPRQFRSTGSLSVQEVSEPAHPQRTALPKVDAEINARTETGAMPQPKGS